MIFSLFFPARQLYPTISLNEKLQFSRQSRLNFRIIYYKQYMEIRDT